MGWNPNMDEAPKDCDVLVWYDHDADPHEDPQKLGTLTNYAAWAESGDFLDGKGVCIAKWFPQFWESVDEYGAGFWMPAAWFALEFYDYERVVNPTHWAIIPAKPVSA